MESDLAFRNVSVRGVVTWFGQFNILQFRHKYSDTIHTIHTISHLMEFMVIIV